MSHLLINKSNQIKGRLFGASQTTDKGKEE